MEISVQLFQIIVAAIWIAGAYCLFTSNNTTARILIGILMLAVFFVNPVRFTQEGVAKIERGINKFDAVPERVIVNTTSFEARQKAQMVELKSKSEDLKDEIHD